MWPLSDAEREDLERDRLIDQEEQIREYEATQDDAYDLEVYQLVSEQHAEYERLTR